jgi:hypothetical protein
VHASGCLPGTSETLRRPFPQEWKAHSMLAQHDRRRMAGAQQLSSWRQTANSCSMMPLSVLLPGRLAGWTVEAGLLLSLAGGSTLPHPAYIQAPPPLRLLEPRRDSLPDPQLILACQTNLYCCLRQTAIKLDKDIPAFRKHGPGGNQLFSGPVQGKIETETWWNCGWVGCF